jgi:hypothetical protein
MNQTPALRLQVAMLKKAIQDMCPCPDSDCFCDVRARVLADKVPEDAYARLVAALRKAWPIEHTTCSSPDILAAPCEKCMAIDAMWSAARECGIVT